MRKIFKCKKKESYYNCIFCLTAALLHDELEKEIRCINNNSYMCYITAYTPFNLKEAGPLDVFHVVQWAVVGKGLVYLNISLFAEVAYEVVRSTTNHTHKN